MDETQKVYESLAAHLDRLPAGFPKTSSGVELRILRRLFTAEEAGLAQLLALKPETPEEIALRTGQKPEELGSKLETMAKKGLIFRIRQDQRTRYMAAQFIVGIWEYHVNDLDPELISDVNEYMPYFFEKQSQVKTSQLRTIPIARALSAEQAVMPYEEARRIVGEHDQILVAPCICRKEHQMTGHGCNKPMESCLIFGLGAQYYEENKLGRRIDQEEALQILEKAEKAGLVLQPSNSQKIMNICTCCGCCCQILKGLKRLPHPAEYVSSNYFAVIDRDKCLGCETCLDRCQMEAVRIEDDTAMVLLDRCIGCGLCVPTCPEEAIRLEAKPEDKRCTPPPHYSETLKRMAKERMALRQAGAE
ncbi:MAG: 4Fe-4S binding protein [Deltaproteobacteria bacterium]|nr:4Fe-4S binding protein [Deltaproteobacteria bacterium]